MIEKKPERVFGPKDQIPFEQVVFEADRLDGISDATYRGEEKDDLDVNGTLEYLATAATQCGLSREHILSFSRFESPENQVPAELVESLTGALVKIGMTVEFRGQEMVVLGLSGWMRDSDELAEQVTRRRIQLGEILPTEAKDLNIDQIELAPKSYFDMGGY